MKKKYFSKKHTLEFRQTIEIFISLCLIVGASFIVALGFVFFMIRLLDERYVGMPSWDLLGTVTIIAFLILAYIILILRVRNLIYKKKQSLFPTLFLVFGGVLLSYILYDIDDFLYSILIAIHTIFIGLNIYSEWRMEKSIIKK